jgi:DNA-binding NtrC family response regulator
MVDGIQQGTPGNGAQTPADSMQPARTTILVVDDDDTVRGLLQEALDLYGYTVVVAATSQEAEDIIQRLTPAAIGLIIIDIHLTADPQAREGYRLYQRWTAVHPALPFLIISGDPDSKTLPAIATGAVRFLAKPFSLSELLQAVQALVRT